MASIPQITIDQQYASVGIEITQAQMKITLPKVEMQLEREMPEMSVEYQNPEFKLNWRKVRSESGLKPPVELSRAYTVRTSNKAVCGISEAAGDVGYISQVEKGGNRIAELTRHKTIKTAQAEINLSSKPQSLPEVEWTPGAVNINWTRGSLNVDWVGNYMPEVVIDPPFSIEIFLREKPYIKIMVEDGTAPATSGTIVDKQL